LKSHHHRHLESHPTSFAITVLVSLSRIQHPSLSSFVINASWMCLYGVRVVVRVKKSDCYLHPMTHERRKSPLDLLG
jgi:hypothetical protein